MCEFKQAGMQEAFRKAGVGEHCGMSVEVKWKAEGGENEGMEGNGREGRRTGRKREGKWKEEGS
jgi:hypothetical protein